MRGRPPAVGVSLDHSADALGPARRAGASARPSTTSSPSSASSASATTARRHLSTGTHRVVDLASIVLARPRLLLLDEPTAGIAQREAEAFIPLLRRLHEVTDTTILLVEHDVPLVFELCSKVVVMERAGWWPPGPPDEVRATPGRWPPILGRATRPCWHRVRSGRAAVTDRGTKECEDGSKHGSLCTSGGVASPPDAVGPVLAAPAPATPDHAGAHGGDRDRHRRGAAGLDRPGALGHPRQPRRRRCGGGRQRRTARPARRSARPARARGA